MKHLLKDKVLRLSTLKALAEYMFNSLPNNKILDVTKLKAFADDKLNVTNMMISLHDSVENTVEKRKNAGYKHFLLFQPCFPNPSS